MAGQGRNAMAATGLLVGLVAMVAVPAAAGLVLPDQRPVPRTGTLDVGYGVRLRPPAGATHDAAVSRPGTGEVVLLSAGLTLRFSAVVVHERPADYLAHTRHKLARDDGLRVGPAAPVRTAAGVSGQRSDVRPADPTLGGDPGCHTVFAGRSAGVSVLVTPVSGCTDVPAAVQEAVAGLTFGEVPAW